MADKAIHCTFCGKSQYEVLVIVAGPEVFPEVFICDECILICNDIVTQYANKATANFPCGSMGEEIEP